MGQWRGRVAVVGLSVLLVASSGACGGGDDVEAYGLSMPSTTTTEGAEEVSADRRAFLDAGNRICEEELGPFANLPDLRSLDGAVDRLQAYDDALARALWRLRDLTPPAADGAQVDELLTAVLELREVTRDMVTALEDRDAAAFERLADQGDQEALEANMLSVAFGLDVCGEG